MPTWKPVLAVTVVSLIGIWLLFPEYLDLQTAPSRDEFRGLVGDRTARATSAAVADLVFTLSYATLGVILYSYVATGFVRAIGTALVVGGAVADEVENVALILNLQRTTPTSDGIDLMLTAGSVKWGLLSAAIILLLALAGQQWLDRRRG